MIDHPHIEALAFVINDYLHEMGQAIESIHAKV